MKNIIKSLSVLTVVFFGFLLFIFTNHIGGWRAFNVMSASMEPAILTGSVVLTKYTHPNTLYNKDIITFIAPTKERAFITHRITKIVHKDNLSIIKTQGDNNKKEDNWTLAGGGVVGRVVYTIPYLGYFMTFAQSKIGILLFILLPAVYIIIDEVFNIVKIIKQHSKKNKTIKEVVTAFLLFFVGLIIYSPNPTYALLSDNAGITQNKFTVYIPINAPELDLRLSDEKKSVSFNVINLAGFSDLAYLLSYKHGKEGIGAGITGTELLSGQQEYSGEIVLGTCSDNSCVYHERIRNIELEVTLINKDGNKVVLRGSIEDQYDPDEFPSCLAPTGKVIANYSRGNHEIISVGLLSGSDYVYQLNENNKERVMQCYCSESGRGIQTNWLKTDDIEGYKLKGWPYSINSGTSWNLDAGSYAAQNVEYKCEDKN